MLFSLASPVLKLVLGVDMVAPNDAPPPPEKALFKLDKYPFTPAPVITPFPWVIWSWLGNPASILILEN